jgi:D-alanyl-D-alanine dipeptidase
MGTDFDFFDPRANTDTPAITLEQRDNRKRLLEAMASRGFRNYPQEWWHFTLTSETSQAIYDIPVE